MSRHEEIKLYGDIGRRNNGESLSDVLDKLEKSDCKNLTIRLHSYGGSVFEGMVMFNAMQRSKIHIKIIIDGIAASMASVLLMAVDDVEIVENGFIMIHVPSVSTQGDSKAHGQAAKLLIDIENNFSRQYSIKTGLTEEEVKAKWLDGKDHWLNADEAVKMGFANRKIASVAKGMESLDKESVRSMDVRNVYDKYAAIFTNKNDDEMKKELIRVFELTDLTEESSDTAVINQLKEKFDKLEAQVKENKEKEQAKKTKTIKSMLDSAVNEGRVTASLRHSLEVVGETSGVDVLSSVLSGMKTRVPIAQLITPESKGVQSEEKGIKNKKDWTLDDYRMHAPRELMNNPTLYDELINKEHGSD